MSRGFSSHHVVAFDIGVRNLAMAWLEAAPTGIRPPTLRHMTLVDLTQRSSNRGGNGMRSWRLYRELIVFLESLDWIFAGHRPCVLIEQQMATRHRANIQALRLSQHVLAYFLHRHPRLQVVEYSAKHKTRVFGFQDACYRKRKLWAVQKASETLQDDPVALDWFNQFQKKDDLADCIVMCLSYLHSGQSPIQTDDAINPVQDQQKTEYPAHTPDAPCGAPRGA